ncbi:hypothetical protein SUGI_0045750 [Cryptomeria japonica]|nr:hypothetical protein SUGI_0045750 [Cryptomeria japonica]
MIIDEMTKEVSLVLNFREDFEWLREKLRSIIGYLRDADAQSAHNESVKSWLLDITEVAWDAEDILDECAVQSTRGTSHKCSQFSCVRTFSSCQLVFRYKMARRIKDVKDRMKSIMEKGAELKLVMDLIHPEQPSTSTSGNVNLRGSSLIESGSRPVGIESKVGQLLHLIDDPASPLIAVVGMGGAGKTFLMQNVFNRIKNKFEKSIWLSVSQAYSLRKLQADLASEIKNLNKVVDGKVSEVQAAKLIHDSLASKRCLVVLDDVWRATGEDDLIYALGLPRGNDTHCKIVVTTRSRNVCGDMDARVYDMQLLSEEESWELFCAFAFPDYPRNQPPKPFEGIAREIERECGRLPLAVKMVAASLKYKRLSSKWQSKLQHIKEASSTNDPIMQILQLSYDSLPAHLKPCFALRMS